MTLLLILSALLSALSGAVVGARAPQVEQIRIEGPVVRVAAALAARTTHRPVASLPRLAAVARPFMAVVMPVARAVPAYVERRRE